MASVLSLEKRVRGDENRGISRSHDSLLFQEKHLTKHWAKDEVLHGEKQETK